MKRLLLLCLCTLAAAASSFTESSEKVGGWEDCNGSDYKTKYCLNIEGEEDYWSCGSYSTIYRQTSSAWLDIHGNYEAVCTDNGCLDGGDDWVYNTSWCNGSRGVVDPVSP